MKVRFPPSSDLRASTRSSGRVKAGVKITMLLPNWRDEGPGVVGVATLVLTSFLAGFGGRTGAAIYAG
jgi:hypothetical protein